MSTDRNDRTMANNTAKTRKQRIIKVTPVTRAVRSALAVSALTLAVGLGGNVATAANHAPVAAHALQLQRASIDFAPVADLTVVVGGHAPLAALAISQYSTGDVVIDNATAITESQPGNAFAISGYSNGGMVGITNQLGADLSAASSTGSAIGIYGYATTGDVAIDNAADITAYSAAGLADGIFASGANVDVHNSGAITAEGYDWAAGIEAQAADVVSVNNSGDISASIYATGQAFGIYATGSDVTVVNSGAIAANGYYATGIEAQSYGNIHIDNSGAITTNSATGLATGINASSGGEGALIAITNTGDISAKAYYGGTGISAVSSGLGGTVDVQNSGSIYAQQGTKYGVGAYGIAASADGDAAVTSSGAITVVSEGAGTGISSVSFAGTASINNSGDVSVTSNAPNKFAATGLSAFSANGGAVINNSGNVSATGKYIATAIEATGLGDVNVNNSGVAYASGDKYAYGVKAVSTAGDVNISNTDAGSIGFNSSSGRGFGVLGVAYTGNVNINNAGLIEGYAYGQASGIFGFAALGDVNISNSGVITSKSEAGAAVGVFARADEGVASIANSGSVDVYSTKGVAYGLFARSDYGVASVSNSGTIVVDGYLAATGIQANGYSGVSINNSGGSLDVFATGKAAGISARSEMGDVIIQNASGIQAIGLQLGAEGIVAIGGMGNVGVANSGAIKAMSMAGDATGIVASSLQGDVLIENHGDVLTYSYAGKSIGLYGYSVDGNVGISNSGAIYAASYDGLADAIFASGHDVTVVNTGALDALGNTWAAGIEAQGANSVAVSNSAAINAGASLFAQLEAAGGVVIGSSSGGAAYGIYATAGEGGALVVNSGALHVMGGQATGIEVQSYGDVLVQNSGNITAGEGLHADSTTFPGYVLYYGSEVGVGINASSNGEGAKVVVSNSGTITASGIFNATGISAVATGTGGAATVVNTGNIYATQNVTAGVGAEGISVSADGDAQLSNSGKVVVESQYAASGLTALSFAGDVLVVNSGDVSVNNYAQQRNPAYGILAFAANGSATAGNSGNILVQSLQAAYGMDISAMNDVVISNSGGTIKAGALGGAVGIKAGSTLGDITIGNASDITVAGVYFGSVGIQAISQLGDVLVSNSGDISANGLFEKAVGIYSSGAVDSKVINTGNITAYSGTDRAIGISAIDTAIPRGNYAYYMQGTTSVLNSGTITLNAPYTGLGQGTGIMAIRNYGEVVVGNSGDINITSGGRSYGIYAYVVEGNVGVTNTGDITITSPYDAAIGIQAIAGNYFFGGGDATVKNSGDISVHSGNGVVIGIGAVAGSVLAPHGNSYILNTGDVTADSPFFSYGIQTRATDGNATVINTGHIQVATSAYLNAYSPGTAMGISVIDFVGGDLTLKNAGKVDVNGYVFANGLHAHSKNKGNAFITNTGDVTVTSVIGIARGVYAYSPYGNITINNGVTGHIEASGGQAAVGMQTATINGNVVINNAGSIHASNAGHTAAVLFDGLLGTNTLNNFATGVIRADGPNGTAYAVVGSDGVEIINNSGKLQGALSLYAGDDVLNNKAGGVWDLLGTTHTDFGAGNDAINNSAGGTITIGSGKMDMGAGNDSLTNAGLITIGNAGVISFGDGNDTVTNAGLITLAGGGITMGAGNNTFTNGGAITSTGTGNSIDVGAAGTFNSGGLLNFVNGLTTDKLAITGTFAGAGNLNLDFNLANATVDQLAVTGSMAASAAQKVNVAFPGMPLTAHTSALFATVSGTSVAGNFVPGQMIGYNYAANFLDVGLTVSSVIDASNVAADKFSINVDVNGLNDTGTLAAAAATGAAGVMNTQMGTFRQRLGVNPYGDAGKVLSAFVRVYNEQGDMKPGHMAANFGQGGHFNYNQASWGREVGVNANLFENLHAGLVLGNADSRQRLTDGGMGENRLNGATVGGYVTWYVPGGFYVDFNARKMGADIRSTSAAGQLTSRSNTTAMSLEAGYEWNVGSFNLVPQAQFTHTKVEALKNFFGDRVNFEAHGGNFTRARLGVEMNKTFQMGDVRWTPYGSLNAVRDSSGKSSYTVGNFYGSTDMRGTSAMAEVGLGVQKGGLGFNIGASWTDGGAYKSFVGGQASVRFAW